MQFSPEAQILILNGVILGVAYLGIFPSLHEKTINRIMTVDLILTVIAMVVAGGLFASSGQSFTLLIIETNWAVYTLVTLFVIEIPLFLNFAKRHGINIFEDPDDKGRH